MSIYLKIEYEFNNLIVGQVGSAKFAQETYKQEFSTDGKRIYTKLTGEDVNTIDDLSNLLKEGKINVSDIPIDYIVRDGNTLILNTRSSQALIKAGIPRTEWNAVNRTGNVKFENMLSNQLSNNKLTTEGVETVRQTQGGNNGN